MFSPGPAAARRVLGAEPAGIIAFHLPDSPRVPREPHFSSTAASIRNVNTLLKAVFHARAAEVLFLKRKASCNHTLTLMPSFLPKTFIKQLLTKRSALCRAPGGRGGA